MSTLTVLVTSAATQLCVVPPGNATVYLSNSTVPGETQPSAPVYIGTSNSVTAAAPNVPLMPGSNYTCTNFGPLATLPAYWAICPAGQTAWLSVSVNLS